MNLKEMFGKRYRVTPDESYEHETEEGKSLNQWRWHEIRGKFGILYPYSKDQLACLFTSIIVANRFKSKGWRVLQNGDFERNVLIPLDSTQEVLKAIRPKKRRQMSLDQKIVAVERLKRYQFRQDTHINSSPTRFKAR